MRTFRLVTQTVHCFLCAMNVLPKRPQTARTRKLAVTLSLGIRNAPIKPLRLGLRLRCARDGYWHGALGDEALRQRAYGMHSADLRVSSNTYGVAPCSGTGEYSI